MAGPMHDREEIFIHFCVLFGYMQSSFMEKMDKFEIGVGLFESATATESRHIFCHDNNFPEATNA